MNGKAMQSAAVSRSLRRNVRSVSSPFEEIQCDHEPSGRVSEPLLVGLWRMIDELLLDRTCYGFPGTLKPVDEESHFRSQRLVREQSRFREAALEVLKNRGRSGDDASVIVLENGHAALAADLDHGRAIGRVHINPLSSASLVAERERDAFHIGRERDPPDPHCLEGNRSAARRRR
jgi:hypothetical protein